MIPLKDENPTTSKPVVTVLLILVCVVVYFGFQQQGDQTEFTYRRAAVPCEVVTGSPMTADEIESGDCTRRDSTDPVFPDKGVIAALVTSIFLHGSVLHLAGNMLYLWVFGNNIEDRMGKPLYLVFYLVAGVMATFAHIALDPGSTVPLVGASGAIAGVMGTYLVLFPRVRIRSLIMFFLIMFRDIEARWLLGIWFVMQFFTGQESGVAWAAHVGGFAFGVVVGLLWRARGGPASGFRPRGYVEPTPYR
ncbi:MAG TPA: rhomboid family intramembrane serine protease [Acidimicrobiales bacterium]|nr:rhomboid family intramembrane serine protease [Acidimicrobiales bacterium]